MAQDAAVNDTALPATVLVVEDDVLLRMFAVEMIEDAGFRVIEAQDADAAIRVLEARNDIRIIFTDIDMPGSMNGLKLAPCASPIAGRPFASSQHQATSG